MVKDNDFLYENLYKFRREKGYSQEELGNIIGVSRQAVSKWETNEIKPSMENIILLCRALDKDISDLSSSMQDVSLNKTEISETATVAINEATDEVKKSNTNIKKALVFILVLFILAWMISAIYKTIVILKINKMTEKYTNINNFSYEITSYEISGNSFSNFKKETTYYKDGIMKRVSTDVNNKEISDMWIDFNNKTGYSYSYEEKHKESIDFSEDIAITNERMLYLLNESIVDKDSYIKCVLIGINPLFLIREDNNNYIFQYKQVNNSVNEWISKNTGLIVKKINRNENGEVINEYHYEFGKTLDSDIENNKES